MKIIADLHVHTISSGHAFSTIQEIAAAAAEKGLKMIAMTDHGPSMPGGPHLFHFKNLSVIPPKIYGVEILRGAEANIIAMDGSLDLPDYILDKLDIVLAGFHKRIFAGGTPEENTQAMINAMKNPYVDVIVHPGNPQFQIIPEIIVEASIEHNVYLEINNSSLTITRKGSVKNCMEIARHIAQKKGRITIGSDSHISFDVGQVQEAVDLVERAGVQPEQILNTSMEQLREFIARRSERRKRTKPIV
jgi:putative hydrolase